MVFSGVCRILTLWLCCVFTVLVLFQPAQANEPIDLGTILAEAIEIFLSVGHDFDKKDPRLIELYKAYSEILWNLKPGDQVKFSNGRVFTLVGFVGTESSGVIWEVKEGGALRFPRGIIDPRILEPAGEDFPELEERLRKGANKFNYVLLKAKSFLIGWRFLHRRIPDHVVRIKGVHSLEYVWEDKIVDPKNPEKPIHYHEYQEELRRQQSLDGTFRGYSMRELYEGALTMEPGLRDVTSLGSGMQMMWNGLRWVFYDFGYVTNLKGSWRDRLYTVWGHPGRAEVQELRVETIGGKVVQLFDHKFPLAEVLPEVDEMKKRTLEARATGDFKNYNFWDMQDPGFRNQWKRTKKQSSMVPALEATLPQRKGPPRCRKVFSLFPGIPF